MVIDNTYFVAETYIPQAQLSISEEVSEVGVEVVEFINEYSEECLILCLGLSLFLEFSSKLDPAKPNGLIDGTDEKWDWLLNGRESYTDSSGKLVRWKGLRYKNVSTGNYNRSLIAY